MYTYKSEPFDFSRYIIVVTVEQTPLFNSLCVPEAKTKKPLLSEKTVSEWLEHKCRGSSQKLAHADPIKVGPTSSWLSSL